MFEYRQVLTRMRLGDTDRSIARAGLMGRRKAAQLRRTAEAAGWLDVTTPLAAPDWSLLAASNHSAPRLGKAHQRENLVRPVDDRLFLAGEASTRDTFAMLALMRSRRI